MELGCIMVVNLEKPSQIPAIAEPWFLCFDAGVDLLARASVANCRVELLDGNADLDEESHGTLLLSTASG
jgi:hypothetical protein